MVFVISLLINRVNYEMLIILSGLLKAIVVLAICFFEALIPTQIHKTANGPWPSETGVDTNYSNY